MLDSYQYRLFCINGIMESRNFLLQYWGHREIRLVYHTPGSRAGGVASAIGILMMVWIAVRRRHTETTAVSILAENYRQMKLL